MRLLTALTLAQGALLTACASCPPSDPVIFDGVYLVDLPDDLAVGDGVLDLTGSEHAVLTYTDLDNRTWEVEWVASVPMR